jgi:polyisoprenoid-binding protein YceI
MEATEATETREEAGKWVIESKYSTVHFSVKSFFFFAVEGTFAEIGGVITRDQADLGRSAVAVVIRADSISTGNRKRDAHLRSQDFLDVERYPEIRFQSDRVERGRDRDTLRLTGQLTICGKSREIVIEVTEVDQSRSPLGEEVAYFTAQTEINRLDYGITSLRPLIGEAVKITTSIQALKLA